MGLTRMVLHHLITLSGAPFPGSQMADTDSEGQSLLSKHRQA